MHFGRPTPWSAAALLTAAAFVAPWTLAHAQGACRVAEVQLSPADAQVAVGGRYPFVATAYDASGRICDNATFTWLSSNRAVAEVEEGGIAVGIAPGQATLTARAGRGAAARSGTATIVVTEGGPGPAAPPIPGYQRVPGRPTGTGYAAFDRQPDGSGPAEQLYVDPLRLTLVRGERKNNIEFRAVRADGQNAARVPIVFTVDPGGERIISVDTLGIITSLGDTGTTNVRLTVPGNPRIQQKIIRVEVRGDQVAFPRPVISMQPGRTDTIQLFVAAQSRAIDPAGFQFISSDTSRVRVNPVQPIFEALAPGRARITAQHPLYNDIHLTINVHRRVEQLRIAASDTLITLPIRGRDTVRVEALAGDGTPVPEAPISWLNPDSSYVGVGGEGGVLLLTGRARGNAVITVTAPGEGERALIQHIRVRTVGGGLVVRQPRLAIPVGQRTPVEALMLSDTRDTIGSANEYLSWRSSADSIARVENNQIVAGRPGRATITGQAPPGWDSTVTVTVYVLGDMLVAAQVGGRRDLHVQWGNPSRIAALTSDTLMEVMPSWSPDLTRAAYAAINPDGRTSALWVMDIDGSNRIRLTDDSSLVHWPRWVRGSNTIIFEWNRGGRPHLWAYDLGPDGGRGTTRPITGTRITGFGHTAPAVSPNGARMVYVTRRERSPGRELNVIAQSNVDGSEESIVYATPNMTLDQPQYSPDGQQLFFIRQEGGGRNLTRRVFRYPLVGAPTDTAVALTPPQLYVRSFSVGADGSLALHVLEIGPNNTQTPRGLMRLNVQTGELTAIGSLEDRMDYPALRPAPR